MANNLTSDFLSIMEEELRAYKDLQKDSHEIQQLLMSDNLPQVKKSVQNQEKHIIEVQTIEKIANKIFAAIGIEFNIPPNKLDLQSVIGKFPHNESTKIKGIYEEISRIKSNLDVINKSNGAMISNALKFLQLINADGKSTNNAEKDTYSRKSSPKKIKSKKYSADFKA